MKKIAICHRCASVKMVGKPRFIGISNIVGCKELNSFEWSKGWHRNPDGIMTQHNCPLLKDQDAKM